jgi:iron complex outermembrane receptor protein
MRTDLRLRSALALGASAIALAAAAPAFAQSKGPDNTTAEVVVTAEKREQSIQHVPVAITAFTAAKRDLVGITSVADLTNFTPGLQYSSQLDRISLRGIGRNSNVHAADAAVATYSDGIYTTSTVEAGKTPLFTSRVEVLRGPQGTLYGRNSIGGAINVISARPTDDWYAEVRGAYENYNHSRLEAAVSGPTPIPGVDFRVAANWEKQTEGWIKNIVPGYPDEGNVIDTKLVEGQLKFKFNDRFDSWMKLSWANWDNGAGGPGSRATWTPAPYSTVEWGSLTPNSGYGCSGNVTGVVNPSPMGCTNPQLTDPRKIASTSPYKVSLDDTWIFASQWNYHFDGFDVRYITGGTHYHYTLVSPPDPTAAPVTQYSYPTLVASGLTVNPTYTSTYQELEQWWSHEINIASTYEGPVQWLLGAYYYTERADQPVYTQLPGQTQTAAGMPTAPIGTCPYTGGASGACLPVFDGRIYDDRPTTHIRDHAFFGQVDWTFATAWKATLGLRWSENEKQGEESVRVLCYNVGSCSGFALTPELYTFRALPGAGAYTYAAYPIDVTQVGAVSTVAQPGQHTGPTTFDPATGFAHRSYGATWSATTGTAGIQWEPDRRTLAYLRYSRGFKAGGFNVGISSTLNPNPYTQAEYVDDIEFGLKKTLGAFVFDAAVFHYNYKNDQIPLSVVNTTGSLATNQAIFYNVPRAVNQGVELEATWTPIRKMQILLDYSYLDATVKSGAVVDPSDPTAVAPGAKPITPTACVPDIYTGGACVRSQNIAGNHLPNSPKNKIALNWLYTFDVGSNMGTLTPSLTYIWRDSQYGSVFDTKYWQSPSWDQIDARLTWKLPGNHLTAILYGRNLGNTIGYEGGATAFRQSGLIGPANPAAALPTTLGGAGAAAFRPVVQGTYSTYPITPPRTYGVELQYKF